MRLRAALGRVNICSSRTVVAALVVLVGNTLQPSGNRFRQIGRPLQQFGLAPDDLQGVVDLVNQAAQQSRHRRRAIERQQFGRIEPQACPALCSDTQVTAPGVDYPATPAEPGRPGPLPCARSRQCVFSWSTIRRRCAEIIINTLNKLGHTEIVEASNGREGIDRLNAADVDMVITDWNMPEMNGIEFIRALRSCLDKTKETPILMVTTNAAKDDIVEALRPASTTTSSSRLRRIRSRRKSRPSRLARLSAVRQQ